MARPNARKMAATRGTLLTMVDEEPYDIEELRKRFPWIGLASIDEPDLSSRYREIMAESRRNREVMEAIDAARRSA